MLPNAKWRVAKKWDPALENVGKAQKIILMSNALAYSNQLQGYVKFFFGLTLDIKSLERAMKALKRTLCEIDLYLII